jgi:hypothetical protein
MAFRFGLNCIIYMTVSDVAPFSRGNDDPREREDLENCGSGAR